MAADVTSPGHAPTPRAAARVERVRVDDPITGLPLLRYRFAGAPTLRPGDPAPTGAWRVLRVEERDGATLLELETNAGAEPLAERPEEVDDAVVAAVLETLERARGCGIAHGDLGAHRLWKRGDRVWVEGYGVRWCDGAEPDDDARTLAASLLALPRTRMTPAARTRLVELRDAGVRSPAAPVRAMVGTAADDLARRRRLALALLLASTAWLGLATWAARRPMAPAVPMQAAGRVVDVLVDPPGGPPVSLVVVSSPPGSRLLTGTVVGSVPSRVMLDRDGRWHLEVRFGDRRSPAVELDLPLERELVLEFPSLPVTAAQ